jgi:hypothetical protein
MGKKAKESVTKIWEGNSLSVWRHPSESSYGGGLCGTRYFPICYRVSRYKTTPNSPSLNTPQMPLRTVFKAAGIEMELSPGNNKYKLKQWLKEVEAIDARWPEELGKWEREKKAEAEEAERKRKKARKAEIIRSFADSLYGGLQRAANGLDTAQSCIEDKKDHENVLAEYENAKFLLDSIHRGLREEGVLDA